jgi:hypothetical protein
VFQQQVSQEPTTRREAEELREAIARSLQTAEPGEAMVIASDLTTTDVLFTKHNKAPSIVEAEKEKQQQELNVQRCSRKR